MIDFVSEAAQLWCQAPHEKKEMDVEFGLSIAKWGLSIAARVEQDTIRRMDEYITNIEFKPVLPGSPYLMKKRI